MTQEGGRPAAPEVVKSFEVRNTGNRPVEFRVEADAACRDWLSAGPESGLIQPEDVLTVRVSARPGPSERRGAVRIRIGARTEEIAVVLPALGTRPAGPARHALAAGAGVVAPPSVPALRPEAATPARDAAPPGPAPAPWPRPAVPSRSGPNLALALLAAALALTAGGGAAWYLLGAGGSTARTPGSGEEPPGGQPKSPAPAPDPTRQAYVPPPSPAQDTAKLSPAPAPPPPKDIAKAVPLPAKSPRRSAGQDAQAPLPGRASAGRPAVAPSDPLPVPPYSAGSLQRFGNPEPGPLEHDGRTVLLDRFEPSENEERISAYSEVPGRDLTGRVRLPYARPDARVIRLPAGSGPRMHALELCPPPGAAPGSSSFVRYGVGEILSIPNGTLEVWVKLKGFGALADQGPFYGSPDGWTFGLGVDDKGVLTSSAWDAFNLASGPAKVPRGLWTHIAVTWGAKGAKLYMDGVLVGTHPSTKGPARGFKGALLLRLASGSACNRISGLRVSNIQRDFSPFR